MGPGAGRYAWDGATRVGAAPLSTFTGLRNAAFTAVCGDSNGPTQIDVLLLWQKSQFTAPGATWSCGTQAAGLMFKVSKYRFPYNFSIHRFFALGAR